MQVVLLERVEKLGHIGEVVKVKDGFARNFLLPKGLAFQATDGAVAIDWFHPSNDGSLVAYGLSEGGTENSVLLLAEAPDSEPEFENK